MLGCYLLIVSIDQPLVDDALWPDAVDDRLDASGGKEGGSDSVGCPEQHADASTQLGAQGSADHEVNAATLQVDCFNNIVQAFYWTF